MTAAVSVLRLKSRLAVLDNGAVVPIQTMIDADGRETDNASECLFAIVPLPCGSWACCDMRDFEDVELH